MAKLAEKKIAVLMTEGFEQIEFTSPRDALLKEGATITLISLQKGKIRAWNEDEWGKSYLVDKPVSEANPDDYDALLLPGGVMNPDKLRMDARAVGFAKAFLEQGKPVAAICHGPQLLIETGLLRGKTLTSFPSLKTDLRNAGVIWVDEVVVIDQWLVTSRMPADLEAFNKAMVITFARQKWDQQKTKSEISEFAEKAH